MPIESYSDDFVFDKQMLGGAIAAGFNVGEISCPTRYFAEASYINFRRRVVYGPGCLHCAWQNNIWRRSHKP